MATDDDQDAGDEELSDELARKYDPRRLLKILEARAGRGAPLEHAVRAKYEQRFGVDLGHVRVVTGEFAEEYNRKRGAHAVTVGATGMILMGGTPEKSMATAEGQALLAHELTHVAQQQRHAGGGLHHKSRGAMPFAEEHEAEAEATEAKVLQEERGPSPADQAKAKAQAAEAMKQQIEKIKARVIALVGESARLHGVRNGSSRRS